MPILKPAARPACAVAVLWFMMLPGAATDSVESAGRDRHDPWSVAKARSPSMSVARFSEVMNSWGTVANYDCDVTIAREADIFLKVSLRCWASSGRSSAEQPIDLGLGTESR